MKQVVQNFKTGELATKEVPVPAFSKGMVLVENAYSLISSGTEKGTVKVAKANLLDKARQRPDLVAQVLQNIKKEGLTATIDKVRTKLDAPKALGYSTAGRVVASMDTGNRFQPGDRVACAGQDYASHAEVVSIPQNLIARIPDTVTDQEAAFTTVGAIALQGVRQADPKLGENVCVIGLGLLGQITCQLLQASGCRVYGVDLDAKLVDLAGSYTDKSQVRSEESLEMDMLHFTNDIGFDAVIIVASTTSNDPVSLAGRICRKKGKVVLVGAVGMDIPRDPDYYRKELDIRMSCSYGPGRYDPNYEERGEDYPIAYVRWTEQRNMEAFLQMVEKQSIDLSSLITHAFPVDQAEDAYKVVMSGEEFHLGILLEYPDRPDKFKDVVPVKPTKVASPGVAFVGAGSFAQSYLIPNVQKTAASLQKVVTSKGMTAENIATKFGFTAAVADKKEIWEDDSVQAVFIATRHDSHASLTCEALNASKHVFVEKPLSLSYEELQEVTSAKEAHPDRLLMVGFNRRFSKAAKQAKAFFESLDEPIVMNFRVNAGAIPADSWIQQRDIGGGRIIGEVCHFIDLMQFLCDSMVRDVQAYTLPGNGGKANDDNLVVNLKFHNNSIGHLTYVSNGGKSLPKEWLEVYAGGKTAIIEDFKAVKFYEESAAKTIKVAGKGHKEEVATFIEAIQKGGNPPISYESIRNTTMCTLRILDSIATGLTQSVE